MWYFLTYLAGCASVGALWYFWPKVTASVVAELKSVKDDIKSKL